MTLLDALQAALAVEHQAVYGYGLVAAHLRRSERATALHALARHQTRRDGITVLIDAMRADPTPAAPAYVAPTPVVDRTTAVALAARLEDAAAGAAWDVVSASGAGTASRRLAVSWLADAAATQATWDAVAGLPTPALPGQPS